METRESRHLVRNNVPLYALTKEALACHRDGTCAGMITVDYKGTFSDWGESLEDCGIEGVKWVPDVGFYFDGILVEKKYWQAGYDHNFFRMPIPETIYVEPYGHHNCLPAFIWCYALEPEEGKVPVPTEGCSTIGDLVKRLHWYQFDGDKYIIVSEETAEKNLTRYVKQYEIFKAVGNDGSRIADYGKLLCFVLKLVEDRMTPTEKALLAPFIENAPDEMKLGDLGAREQKIIDIAKGV